MGTYILRDNKSVIIVILYPYGNSLSMSTGFQITNFNSQQFSIALTVLPTWQL